MSERLADRLAAARRRSFVGRTEELRRFQELLTEPTTPCVIFVHGPGGVGKTALIKQFAWLAEGTGRPTIWLDGREIPAAAAAALQAIGNELGCGPQDDPLTVLEQTHNIILLIDTYESLSPLDRWLRDEVLPRLPAEAVVVLAGRDRPPLGWRTDPGWRELLTQMPLGNLAPGEGRELLRRRGVPDEQQQQALAFTRGHPLALALVADVSAQRPFSPTTAPEVVAALLKSFVDAVPTPAHRLALDACAQVLVITEPLLATLLDQDRHRARELFDWLRDLSIIEHGPRGLFPHDLVRDVLNAEMRWRDPDGCAQIRDRVAMYYRRQFREADPAARRTVLLDFVYLHRERSVLGPFLAGVPPRGIDDGQFAVTSPTQTQWALLRSWVRKHEGAESARLFDHWRTRQPDAFYVVSEGQGDPVGFFMVLRLQDTDTLDSEIDPAVGRALAALGPPALAPGETAVTLRFWMAGATYQAASAVHTFMTLYLSHSYFLIKPLLAYTFLPFADPDFWVESCAYVDFTRTPEADFEVGGRHYGVYGHDWRRVPPLTWLSVLIERESGQALAQAGAPRLSEAAFAAAVREALRDFGRAAGLRGSALLQSRLVAARTDPSLGEAKRIAALREIICDAAAQLEGSPHDRRGYRALHHTYLQPAGTQQRAADLLGLPMSTFRRHLAAGIDRLTALLWQQEQDAS